MFVFSVYIYIHKERERKENLDFAELGDGATCEKDDDDDDRGDDNK